MLWFCFREDSESAEMTSVAVLYHCHCALGAPAEEGGRLSLDLSKGSVIFAMGYQSCSAWQTQVMSSGKESNEWRASVKLLTSCNDCFLL